MRQNYRNDLSTRKDYWSALLGNLIITIVLYLFLGVSGGFAYFTNNGKISGGFTTVVLVVLVLFSLATLLPSIAIQVRRLRDANLHWAWIFLYLVGLGIVVFVLNQLPTKDGEYNQC